jgi:hypothetical protein
MRAALRPKIAMAPTRVGATLPEYVAESTASGAAVAVRYVENAPVRVRGLSTGQTYEFSAAERVRQVDARDSAALLSTRFFQRA